ncbi:NADH dehydrogenase [ubiquinone] 1 alpha subcomplex subunit 2-like [Limulus polyphemus]|uniref:NADH dehydrogenase [ubiquinone] 1 alpha subcomplex subunit 2 n=1 Tax=Limulus polyphemus TaxID=6850 RepID=A0ABM1BEZ9_LIMPO|nr:NADH dehydrogenase [ubiquinone] 1 alpha subcomplex subunit 2-like [Limulus polyphemus]
MAGSNVLKFGAHLKELRLHLCQKSTHSKGVRDFIEKFYVPLKKNNPRFPILIRECSGVQPKIYARYEHGKETSVSLADMNDNQVFQTLEKLSTK